MCTRPTPATVIANYLRLPAGDYEFGLNYPEGGTSTGTVNLVLKGKTTLDGYPATLNLPLIPPEHIDFDTPLEMRRYWTVQMNGAKERPQLPQIGAIDFAIILSALSARGYHVPLEGRPLLNMGGFAEPFEQLSQQLKTADETTLTVGDYARYGDRPNTERQDDSHLSYGDGYIAEITPFTRDGKKFRRYTIVALSDIGTLSMDLTISDPSKSSCGDQPFAVNATGGSTGFVTELPKPPKSR